MVSIAVISSNISRHLCLEMNKGLAVLGTDSKLESNVFKRLLEKDIPV